MGALYCKNGDENFKSTIKDVNKFFDHKSVDWVKSSASSTILLFKLKNINCVYLVNKNVVSELVCYEEKFNGLTFSEFEDYIYYTYDDQIDSYNFNTQNSRVLFSFPHAQFTNLSSNRGFLYFSSNYCTHYFSIFKLKLGSIPNNPVVVMSDQCDLRLPKIFNNNLYFVKVINGEYLLHICNLSSMVTSQLTKCGVVYDYFELSGKGLYAIYSDFLTPKTILCINSKKFFQPINYKHIDLKITYKLLSYSNLSSAYIYYPPKGIKIKGKLIFFHPGLHSNFSPRWDTLLMILCKMGFVVISPNYPMSEGFGKRYLSLTLNDAIPDIIKWSQKSNLLYSEAPLYYLSYSSGNVLMESVLHTGKVSVKGSVSLFGVPSNLDISSNNILFFLGVNDPVINYDLRYSQLRGYNISKKSIYTFQDEGHWLRNNQNTERALKEILYFFR